MVIFFGNYLTAISSKKTLFNGLCGLILRNTVPRVPKSKQRKKIYPVSGQLAYDITLPKGLSTVFQGICFECRLNKMNRA